MKKMEYKLPMDDQEEEDYEDNDIEEDQDQDDMDGEEAEDQVAQDLNSHKLMNQQQQQQLQQQQQQQQQQMYMGNNLPNNSYSNMQQYQQPLMNQAPMGGNMRMRPQSAKTGNEQQMRFQQPPMQQQMAYSNQAMGPQWVGGQQQQQQFLNNDPSQFQYQQQQQQQQPYGNFFGQGGIQQNGLVKKRPTTASRKANIQFGNQKKSVQSKNPSNLDLEVQKLRPRIVHQEKERLYDDALKQKMAANFLKDENTRLKTRIFFIESEMSKKEKLIDDLLQQESNGRSGGPKVKLEGHLALNLKRKIREMQAIVQTRQEEIEILRRNIKSTKMAELEVEMKMYADECTRLRHQLEDVIKSKDAFADPEELKHIEAKFAQQDAMIQQLQLENSELAQAFQKKDEENRQLRDIFAEIQGKQKKQLHAAKEANKLRKQIKQQDKELKKAYNEVTQQKHINEEYKAKIDELVKRGPPTASGSQRPQSAAPASNALNVSHTAHDSSKVSELNSVIQQLQLKLQGKIDELQRETQEKLKYKDRCEDYQNRIVELEAQLEDGGHAVPAKKKVTEVNKPIQQQQQQVIQQQQQQISENKPQQTTQAKAQLKPRIDKKQVADIGLELRLKLQCKGFYSNQIQDFFFKPFSPDTQVSIKQLQGILETNGVEEKKAQNLARYVIEPKVGGQILVMEDNSKSQQQIIDEFHELIGRYSVFNDANQAKRLSDSLIKLFSKVKGTLKDALESEDYDESGTLPHAAFESTFLDLELVLTPEQLEYLLFVVYQRSESLDKMKYNVLFDLLEGKLVQGQLSVGSQEGGSRKRPESSSPEKLKARNKEKYNSNEQPAKVAEKEAEDEEDQEYDENYEEEEFDQFIGKDEEDEQHPKQLAVDQAEEEDDEDYLGEEDMLDVAEKCFVRIAEAIIASNLSVRSAFQRYIIREQVEDQDGAETIELLSPIGFLEGIKDLGITDFEEVEVACLMRVLTKQDLENAILLRELIVIMDNFGIKDDGPTPEEIPDQGKDAGKKKKKKAEKPLDLSQLDEKSIKIMAKLMIALMELNVSLYDFFEGFIYEQAVKTKTKQNTVEILNSTDFYGQLEKSGVRKSAKDHENLTKFLSLDPNYPQLMMLKKVAKTLDEMAKNEELMAGIFGAEGDDQQYQQEEGEEGEQRRLVTIGEDGEDRYDTSKGRPHPKQQQQQQEEEENEDYEQDYEENYDDDE